MIAAQIITKPLLTEKGTSLGEANNQVLFEVALEANKIQIRRAIQQLYDVRVVSVRTQVVHGKLKRVGRNTGRRRKWKKAIVKLAEGSTIDFFATS